MAENYISRQSAIDALIYYIHNVDRAIGTGRLTMHDCKEAAESVLGEDSLPSADVVEVVRCKDCDDYQTKFRWCKLHDGEMQPTDFCSYGERRDGSTNSGKLIR